MPIFEQFTKGQMDAHEMLNANFAAVETQLSNKANKGRELTWVEAPLLGDATGYFSYGRDQLGKVEIFCNVKLPSPLTREIVHITTLPEGFRPLTASRIHLFELSHDSSSGNSIGSLRILTETGEVSVLSCVDNSRTDLDTIRINFSYTAR